MVWWWRGEISKYGILRRSQLYWAMERQSSCSNNWLWYLHWFWSAGCHSLLVWQYHHWFTSLTRCTELKSYSLHIQTMFRAPIFCSFSSDLNRLAMWCEFGLFTVDFCFWRNRVFVLRFPKLIRSKLRLALLHLRQTKYRRRCVQLRSWSHWLCGLVLSNRHAMESELLSWRTLRSIWQNFPPTFARLLCN